MNISGAWVPESERNVALDLFLSGSKSRFPQIVNVKWCVGSIAQQILSWKNKLESESARQCGVRLRFFCQSSRTQLFPSEPNWGWERKFECVAAIFPNLLNLNFALMAHFLNYSFFICSQKARKSVLGNNKKMKLINDVRKKESKLHPLVHQILIEKIFSWITFAIMRMFT